MHYYVRQIFDVTRMPELETRVSGFPRFRYLLKGSTRALTKRTRRITPFGMDETTTIMYYLLSDEKCFVQA